MEKQSLGTQFFFLRQWAPDPHSDVALTFVATLMLIPAQMSFITSSRTWVRRRNLKVRPPMRLHSSVVNVGMRRGL